MAKVSAHTSVNWRKHRRTPCERRDRAPPLHIVAQSFRLPAGTELMDQEAWFPCLSIKYPLLEEYYGNVLVPYTMHPVNGNYRLADRPRYAKKSEYI